MPGKGILPGVSKALQPTWPGKGILPGVGSALQPRMMIYLRLFDEKTKLFTNSNYRFGEGWIEIMSYSFGPSANVFAGNGHSLGTELSLTTQDDRVYSQLVSLNGSGKTIANAILRFERLPDKVEIVLQDVWVSHSSSGSLNDGVVYSFSLQSDKSMKTIGKAASN